MSEDRPFNDKVEADEAPKMPAEYQALLKRVLRIQADCEIGGPHLYVTKWLLAAPSADDQWMLAKVAGEEIDHLGQQRRRAERGPHADWVDVQQLPRLAARSCGQRRRTMP